MVRALTFGLAAAVAASVAAGPVQRSTTDFKAGSPESIANMKSKVKKVVHLIMENRSVDTLLGGQKLHNLDNPINNGPFCNPRNVTDPSKGIVCTEAKEFDEILDDPAHDIEGYNLMLYSTYAPDNDAIANGTLKATSQGYLQEQLYTKAGRRDPAVLEKQIMNYYTEEQVPVLTAMCQNFVTFNNWHSDIPGPTSPNRAAALAGTCEGREAHDPAYPKGGFTSRSIFQQLGETNHSWVSYTDSSAAHKYFSWVVKGGYTKAPYVMPVQNFFQDAYLGRLPDYSFITPSCCDPGTVSMHPTGLISDGEVFLKQVYDALRTGAQWNETLLIVTFDESGGFHDHVAPPLAPRPDNGSSTATTPDKQSYTFPYNRLGGRVPTWLISPWVRRGHVEKLGTNAEGEAVSYYASSVLRTLGYLWDFEPFNPRVAAAPSFDHLFEEDSMRNTLDAMPAPFAFKK